MLLSPFLPYLIARICFTLSTTILSVAIGWHIYQLTGDPFDLALIGLVQIIPVLALFILTGWVVDRFSRRTILILCAIAETSIYFALAMVMHQESVNTFSVFALLFAHGCTKAFFGPVQQAILPNLVTRDALSRAIAITTTAWNAASTGGPFVAGLLIAWLDIHTYWLLGLLTAIAALLLLTLPKLPQEKPMDRGIKQVLAGIRFIQKNPFVLGSITLDLLVVLLGSVIALLPIYAVDVLHVGPGSLGLLRGMPALGAVVVGVALTQCPPLKRAGKTLFAALALFSGSILLFAFSSSLWLSLLALFCYGGTDMISMNVRSTLVQLATPDELRGRVSAVNSIFIASSNDLGDFRAGTVAAFLPPVATVALGGMLALMVTTAGYFLFPAIRHLNRLDEASCALTSSKK